MFVKKCIKHTQKTSTIKEKQMLVKGKENQIKLVDFIEIVKLKQKEK
jgi:hypothetical protein